MNKGFSLLQVIIAAGILLVLGGGTYFYIENKSPDTTETSGDCILGEPDCIDYIINGQIPTGGDEVNPGQIEPNSEKNGNNIPPATQPPTVETNNDYSCITDSECVVKNQQAYCCGQTAGYIDSCFHTDEPPRPLSSIDCSEVRSCAGFAPIEGCVCQDNTCKSIISTSGGPKIVD